MIRNVARFSANVAQLLGGVVIVAAGFELRHWLGLALAGVLVILAGIALEREVS